MFEGPNSEYFVPYDGDFKVSESNTRPQTDAPARHKGKYHKKSREKLSLLQ